MSLPEGIDIRDAYEAQDIGSSTCLKLQKSIYGLVQAAREFWKKFMKTLRNLLKFKRRKSDPCLLYREDESGLVILCVYVDDALVVGTKKSIKKALDQLEKQFNLKRNGPLKDFIGCDIHRDKEKKKGWLTQFDLIKKMTVKFKKEYSKMKTIYKTPSPPKEHVVRPKEGGSTLDTEMQTRYRSGVGMLLYLVKISRPDLANCTRELSKVMDKSNIHHYNLMLRAVKYVGETNKKCLTLKLRS